MGQEGARHPALGFGRERYSFLSLLSDSVTCGCVVCAAELKKVFIDKVGAGDGYLLAASSECQPRVRAAACTQPLGFCVHS